MEGFLTLGGRDPLGDDPGARRTRLLNRRTITSAVRRLGGAWTCVSAVHGSARMDVCGGADGALLVYVAERAVRRDDWALLMSVPAPEGVVGVRIGGGLEVVDAWQAVTRSSALRAARHFAATGRRHPAMPWYRSADVFRQRSRIGDVLGDIRVPERPDVREAAPGELVAG